MSKPGVSRYCACRGEDGRLLGKRCPQLQANRRHGKYMFTADRPTAVGARRDQVHRRGFASERAAAAARDEVLGRVKQGVKADDQERTDAFLTAWLEGKRKIRPSTRASYVEHVTLWSRLLGHVPLEQLRHEHIDAAVSRVFAESAKRRRAGPVKPSTVERQLATLRSALGSAVKSRRLTHNPAAHVELPEYRRPDVAPWTPEEAGAFLDASQAERLLALYELVMVEGLRRGEVCGLCWDCVDLDAAVLWIRPGRNRVDVSGHVHAGDPKSRSGMRAVPLGARSVQVLAGWRVRQELERAEWNTAWTETGHVFTQEDGQPLRPEFVSRNFRRMVTAAGARIIRFHDLRHTAASLALAAGTDRTVVSKRIGHSSTRITDDLYSHLYEGVGRSVSDAVAGIIPRGRDHSVTTGPVGRAASAPGDDLDRDESPGQERRLRDSNPGWAVDPNRISSAAP